MPVEVVDSVGVEVEEEVFEEVGAEALAVEVDVLPVDSAAEAILEVEGHAPAVAGTLGAVEHVPAEAGISGVAVPGLAAVDRLVRVEIASAEVGSLIAQG